MDTSDPSTQKPVLGLSLLDMDESAEEEGVLPPKFSDLEDSHFPLFLTYDQVYYSAFRGICCSYETFLTLWDSFASSSKPTSISSSSHLLYQVPRTPELEPSSPR